ncbi:coiled-coil domain-containing protein 124 [Aplysia californica]|uniref:Coiled-coil domain-containing protein 124 n=1 Tax=Aplysia californica TaxID=6500 RepID=A0ABM0JWH4_APLCA|nr:coiled-coil domain-containing protein 124 [Aplysia californica]XP_012940689.1 coiled-coil domain-containing protein 124 [Aplysia californica]
MPKKFKGENSKAAEARARKDAVQKAEKERVEKEKEDALWADDDKHNARKLQRKDDKEKKRLEQLERKKELQQLHEEEMSSIKGAKAQAAKVSRAQILENQERAAAEAKAEKAKEQLSHDEVPLEENVNLLVTEGEDARTVDDAIAMLSVAEPSLDKHPEKRVKAAYSEFEALRLPVLKQENPNMRLSQLKQMLKKEWMKSPENPLNQRHSSYNSKS